MATDREGRFRAVVATVKAAEPSVNEMVSGRLQEPRTQKTIAPSSGKVNRYLASTTPATTGTISGVRTLGQVPGAKPAKLFGGPLPYKVNSVAVFTVTDVFEIPEK
jgi:hypothetical protein